MKSFLLWFLSPSRALAQAQTEIEYLRGEVRRLNDLLVQIYEAARVVPVQPQHQAATVPEPEQMKTLGQMQRDFADERIRKYNDWLRDELVRQDNMRAINESQKPN